MSENKITCVESGEFEKRIVNFDFHHKIRQVASGIGYCLILTENGEVYFKGKLKGYDSQDFIKIETNSFIAFIASGEFFFLLMDQFNQLYIYGDFGKTYSKLTESVKIEDEIKFISCGADIVVFVTQNNELIIGGCVQAFDGFAETLNDFIKIDKLPTKQIKDLQCGYYHTIILDDNGNVFGSGENTRGQLGKLEEGISILSYPTKLNIPFKVKKIATAPEGTLLLNYHNELYGSGENTSFQLGTSDNKDVKEFTKIIVNNNITIKKVFSCALSINCILTDDGFYVIGQKNYKSFTKLNEIDCNWKYNYAMLNIENCKNALYIFQTNYKINSKQKKQIIALAHKKLLNNSLSDVVFHLEE